MADGGWDVGYRGARWVMTAALVAGFLAAALTLPTPAQSAPRGKPNVVVFMVDDQPKGLIDAMPFTQQYLFGQGTTFRNGMIPTSLCCPSRSAFLTGWLANTTGVWTNKFEKIGGYSAFQPFEGDTIATALDDAGYHTAMVGKYMNDFNLLRPRPSYVPPGWDEFAAIAPHNPARDSTYYNYRLSGTADHSIHYGRTESDYSTDVLADTAADIISSAPEARPLFLYFAPYSVHSPWLPAPRHLGTWPLEPASAIPALDEDDVSDKPDWVSSRQRVDPLAMRQDLTLQHEMSMSLDDAVRTVTEALGDRADDTMFVYISDNGYMHGSHRLLSKDVPYSASTTVPMAIKWDGLPAGRSGRIVTNVDLTATIAEAAGLKWKRDGRSALSTGRKGTVLEQVGGEIHPSYCGWRNRRYMFVQYDTGEREFYDYRKDPEELRNRAEAQKYSGRVDALRARAKAACKPAPPGFHW